MMKRSWYNEGSAHIDRREFIEAGKSVSLIALEPDAGGEGIDMYTFDVYDD